MAATPAPLAPGLLDAAPALATRGPAPAGVARGGPRRGARGLPPSGAPHRATTGPPHPRDQRPGSPGGGAEEGWQEQALDRDEGGALGGMLAGAMGQETCTVKGDRA